MEFEKCHGLGNDYIYVRQDDMDFEEASRRAPPLCRRGPGIGADGIVVLRHRGGNQVDMRMVNADGSEGLICGNALRCVGLLARRWDWTGGDDVVAHTPVGERRIHLEHYDPVESMVTVEMGSPAFGSRAIGALHEDPLVLPGPQGDLVWAAVSMGNPHVVGFVDSLEFDLAHWGPIIAAHSCFPGGVNANFTQVQSPDRLVSRIWERGSGPTLACGSGACAGYAAAREAGLVGDRAQVVLPLGELAMAWDETAGILMTGPASWSFTGILG